MTYCGSFHYNVHKYKESGKEEYEQIIIEELKKYADFEIKNRSIYIKEIYISEYIKMKHFDLVKDSLVELWCPNNLDTCKNVTKKLTKKYDKEELPL